MMADMRYVPLDGSEGSEDSADDSHMIHRRKRNQISVDLDEVFDYVGHCGYFQISIGFMLCLLNIPAAYEVLIMYFTGFSPPWQCSAAGKDECNLKGPIDSSMIDEYSLRCRMKRESWEYTMPKMNTVVTEFNLICDKASLATLTNSAFYVGWAVGALPTGMMSDMYGRKPVFVFSYICLLLSSFLSGYIYVIWQLTALRFIIGLAMTGVTLNLFVILTELVGPKYRAHASSIYFLGSTIGLILLTYQAYLMPNWRTLCVLTSAPYALMIIFVIFIPESVRWLHLNGKTKEVQDILMKAADMNGKDLPKITLRAIRTLNEGAFVDLFMPKEVLRRSLIQSFHWAVLGMTYYGISLSSADLTGSFYRDFVLVAVAEIPCVYIVISATEQYGRKNTVIWSLIGTSLCCLTIAFTARHDESFPVMELIRIGGAILGKFFISTAFNAYYIWSSELFPTVIRLQALSFVGLMARLGSSLAPVVSQSLKLVSPVFPFAVMGLSCVLSASMALFLPETKGKPTLETIEDLVKGSLQKQKLVQTKKVR